MGGLRTAKLIRERQGSMALWASIMIGLSILIGGGVVDYMSLSMQNKEVQGVADRAALAAAHELVLASDAETRVQEVATAYVKANYSRQTSVAAAVIEGGGAVHVTVTTPPRVFFPGPIGANAGPVSAESTAEVVGEESNVCLVALDEEAGRALSLDSNASVDAPACAIYSNSTDSKGLSALSNSRLVGDLICTAGGKEGSVANFDPDPVLDCPQIEDPLAERPTPPVGACNYNKKEFKDYTGKINPGVYCGGLRIDGNSKVTLEPGVYVMKDGELRIDSNSEVTGEGVGFFFTGDGARFEFTSNAKVSLSAPKTGVMAGLLFMEDRTLDKLTKHRITSNYADRLVGTIYMPRGSMLIDANQDVADESEFTVLVVRQLELKAGPRLVLNTDYGASTVPVPEGVGNRGDKGVRLVQ